MDVLAWAKEFFNTQMQTNDFFQGGLVLGLLSAVAIYLKNVPSAIWSRMERRFAYEVIIEQRESYHLYEFLEDWLSKNHTKDYRRLKGRYEAKEGESAPRLLLEQIDDWFYVFKFGRYIRISQSRDKLEGAMNLDALFNEQYVLYSWFGSKSIKKLLALVVKEGEDRRLLLKKTSASIYEVDHSGDVDYMCNVDVKPLSNIFIKNKKLIVDDIDKFLQSKDWYKKRAIAWKRGYLFEGLPGNGKTTLALSLAQNYGMELVAANISNMNDNMCTRMFSNISANSVLLLEDIDAMFSDKRDVKSSRGDAAKLSFSTLLNCLDGVFSKEGLITIMTTNHAERLDSALIRRGRVDVRCEVSNPRLIEINRYLKNFYSPEAEIIIPAGRKYEENMSMVDVQNICIDFKDSPEVAIKTLRKEMIINTSEEEVIH